MIVMENRRSRMAFGSKAKSVHRHAIELLNKLKDKSDIQTTNYNKLFNDLANKAEGLEILLEKAEAKIEKLEKKNKGKRK